MGKIRTVNLQYTELAFIKDLKLQRDYRENSNTGVLGTTTARTVINSENKLSPRLLIRPSSAGEETPIYEGTDIVNLSNHNAEL